MSDLGTKREINFNLENDAGVTFSPITASHSDTEHATSFEVDANCWELDDRRTLSGSSFALLVQKMIFLTQWYVERIAIRKKYCPLVSADERPLEEVFHSEQSRLRQTDAVLRYSLINDATRVPWQKLKRLGHLQRQLKPGISYDEQGCPIGFERSAVVDPPPSQKVVPDPEITFLDRLFPHRAEQKKLRVNEARNFAAEVFARSMQRYEAAQSQREEQNRVKAEEFQQELAAYGEERAKYDSFADRSITQIKQLEDSWRSGSEEGVIAAAELQLYSSVYPDWYSYRFDLSYVRESKTLVVDSQLPMPEKLPTSEPINFNADRQTIKRKAFSASAARRRYDDVCYQIALRTIHELFQADEPHALSVVAFNGWVEAPSPATGRIEKSCVLSVQAHKEEFLTFDLLKVNPKSCFLALKGVAAASLADLVPVRPVIRLGNGDSRFVEGRHVGDALNDSVNLAAMNWEDFEHLVRELFAKIFSGPGSEVKVTRASRDGGVDAIALDPDPIKGGKIVIQAKRYTNTVDVGAVRDLYGTVLNEGANRGILVTTSNYDPDAYKFALNKPITLINGSNLLSLLEQRGQKAKIDLKEAKQIARASQAD